MSRSIPVGSVRYVKELYPRLQPDDATIDAYRMALDSLPPIVVARDSILVDGYHRWQAYVREGIAYIEAEELGELTDDEIFWQSIERNAVHGKQLTTADKRRIAEQRYETLAPKKATGELAARLKVDESTVRRWTKDARAAQEEQRHAAAYDLWLDCLTQEQIAAELDVTHKTIDNWLGNFAQLPEITKAPGATNDQPWGSVQHFDIWTFPHSADDSSYFGRMPPQVVENLLWFFTDPGQVVVDPFAGAGTTIKVAKRMGRRVWASDLQGDQWDKTLPIHQHDVQRGWPADAPSKAQLIVLDPPYWQQAKGRYSEGSEDLGNLTLSEFYAVWHELVCEYAKHLAPDGHLAYVISPTQCDDGSVIDHATDMLQACNEAGLRVARRVIVPYQTQQATGQQVTWARENRRLLKLYRDLVVLRA